METEANRKASNEFGRIRGEYQAQAWLYGTTTTKEFTGFKKPAVEELTGEVPEGDYVAGTERGLYYVSLNTLGEIAWESGTYQRAGRPDSHVVEILTETTPLCLSIPTVEADFRERSRPSLSWSREQPCWREKAFQETALKAPSRRLSIGSTALVC